VRMSAISERTGVDGYREKAKDHTLNAASVSDSGTAFFSDPYHRQAPDRKNDTQGIICSFRSCIYMDQILCHVPGSQEEHHKQTKSLR
jgi:hypothetical protein